MLSLFRRKTPPPLPTFNERVTAFWAWFAREAPRLYATIEEGWCPSLSRHHVWERVMNSTLAQLR